MTRPNKDNGFMVGGTDGWLDLYFILANTRPVSAIAHINCG